jgi:hypothetical protein
MKHLIALAAAILGATATYADDRDRQRYLDRQEVEQMIRDSERRAERDRQNREAQRELEADLDSIFYPTPQTNCTRWYFDCGRASRGGR